MLPGGADPDCNGPGAGAAWADCGPASRTSRAAPGRLSGAVVVAPENAVSDVGEIMGRSIGRVGERPIKTGRTIAENGSQRGPRTTRPPTAASCRHCGLGRTRISARTGVSGAEKCPQFEESISYATRAPNGPTSCMTAGPTERTNPNVSTPTSSKAPRTGPGPGWQVRSM